MRQALATLLFGALCTSAHGALRLSDFFVELHGAQRGDALFAHNEGDEVLYLEVRVEEVLDPLADPPNVRQADDPRSLGLLVSPQRLVLQPGEEGRIRTLAMTQPDQDRFYKVTVVPVTGALQSDQSVGVKVMIGYSAWVFIRPEGARPVLEGSRREGELLLRNAGDTLARLVRGRQCDAHGRCERLEPVRVLAGQSKSLPLPLADGEVTFRMVWGNESLDLVF